MTRAGDSPAVGRAVGETARRPVPPVLVFDGDCGICTTLASSAQRWLRPRAAIRPWQDLDLDHLGLTAAQCDESLRLVDAGGGQHAAQNAVARLLLLSRPGWRPLGMLLLVPGVNAVAGLAYRWVARNRARLPGGTPACALPANARARSVPPPPAS